MMLYSTNTQFIVHTGRKINLNQRHTSKKKKNKISITQRVTQQQQQQKANLIGPFAAAL